MKITVKTTVDTAKLAAIDEAAQRALALTAEVIHGQVVQAQVMPFRTGHLQNESTFVDTSGAAEGHVDIVSATPYARRLYYHPEYNFDTTNNPSAGGMWFAPWAAGGEYSETATATFAALLKRGGRIMTMDNLLDWLESLNLADHVYANRLENKKEKSLGIYNRTIAGTRPVMAIGGVKNSSYDILPLSLLVHWTRSFPETETAAQAVWDQLIEAKHIDIPGGQHVQFVRMTTPGPVYVATDANGIHEYVINFNLYYRR